MDLDSIYAMLARPAPQKMELKPVVKALNKTERITKDSHEAPHSQLPPNLERRQAQPERRDPPQSPSLPAALERRKLALQDRRARSQTSKKADESDNNNDSDQAQEQHIDIII